MRQSAVDDYSGSRFVQRVRESRTYYDSFYAFNIHSELVLKSVKIDDKFFNSKNFYLGSRKVNCMYKRVLHSAHVIITLSSHLSSSVCEVSLFTSGSYCRYELINPEYVNIF